MEQSKREIENREGIPLAVLPRSLIGGPVRVYGMPLSVRSVILWRLRNQKQKAGGAVLGSFVIPTVCIEIIG
jgi:hypothetical protein